MRSTNKLRRILRRAIQSCGPTYLKSRQWNGEYSRGRWDCLENTPGDCVYPFIAKHARGGDILDLGCGSGSTANELSVSTYNHYTGVDISDVAIMKARKRAEECGRAHNSEFLQSEFFSYVPCQQFDVILFRDSICYVRLSKIKTMLNRYSRFLKENGVFIVRLDHGNDSYRSILDVIDANFNVKERFVLDKEPKAAVVVFCLI